MEEDRGHFLPAAGSLVIKVGEVKVIKARVGRCFSACERQCVVLAIGSGSKANRFINICG